MLSRKREVPTKFEICSRWGSMSAPFLAAWSCVSSILTRCVTQKLVGRANLPCMQPHRYKVRTFYERDEEYNRLLFVGDDCHIDGAPTFVE